MSSDKVDSTINQLYRERKANVQAPDIKIVDSGSATQKTQRWPRLFSIVGLGGLASFGILAVISHLSQSPELATSIDYVPGVEVEMITPTAPNHQHIKVVRKPLPPKPPAVTRYAQHTITFTEQLKQVNAQFDNDMAHVIELPQISNTAAEIEPIYKVMPHYAKAAILRQQSGTVTLSYSVTANGQVSDIDVLAATVDRDLQKSARQALSQWQFKPNVTQVKQEVVFEFTLDKP